MSINSISNVTSAYSRNNTISQKNQKLSFGMNYEELTKMIKDYWKEPPFDADKFTSEIHSHVDTPDLNVKLATIKSIRENIKVHDRDTSWGFGRFLEKLADSIEKNMYDGIKID